MKEVFVYSDPHFWHSRVIDYEKRPYNTVEEMNYDLIKKFNSVVKSREDKVFILGDFSFSGAEKTYQILKQLNGYKILIMGNHDRRNSPGWWSNNGFDQVSQYPIIYNNRWILSHEPVIMTKDMPYINIHGHLHSKQMIENNYFNASCENTDYKPYNLNLIKEKYFNKEVENEKE